MTERVWIFLIVAIAIIVVVFLLRKKLSRLLFKGGGIEAEVATHNQAARHPSRSAVINSPERDKGLKLTEVTLTSLATS
jgi:preprotein translocase subunit SecG